MEEIICKKSRVENVTHCQGLVEGNKLISGDLYKGNSIIRYCSMKGKLNPEEKILSPCIIFLSHALILSHTLTTQTIFLQNENLLKLSFPTLIQNQNSQNIWLNNRPLGMHCENNPTKVRRKLIQQDILQESNPEIAAWSHGLGAVNFRYLQYFGLVQAVLITEISRLYNGHLLSCAV